MTAFAHSLWHDSKIVLRATVSYMSSLNDRMLAGIPLDRLLHFGVALGLFLILVRFISRTRSLIIVIVLMIAKELWDYPAKRAFLAGHALGSPQVDTFWDLFAGAVGLLLGFGLYWLIRDRWHAPPQPQPRPIADPARPMSPPLKTALISLACAMGAVFIGINSVEIFRNHNVCFWLVHMVAISAVWVSCRRFGAAATLIVAVPLMPFANWVQMRLALSVMDVNISIIFALAFYEIIRLTRSKDPRIRFGGVDWLIVAFAVFACFIVTINNFRLGWHPQRMMWFLVPLSAIAIYLLARQLLDDARKVTFALAALAASVALICLIGMIEFIVRPLALEATPGSVFYAAPDLGLFLSFTWPLFLALALRPRVKFRWLYIVAAALGLLLLFIVFNRSSWAAAGGSAVTVIVLMAWRRDLLLGLAVSVALVATGATAYTITRNIPVADIQTRLAREGLSILKSGSFDSARHGSTVGAEKIIAKSPFLGSTGEEAHMLYTIEAIAYGIPGAWLWALAILAVLASNALLSWKTHSLVVTSIVIGVIACVAGGFLSGLGWSMLSKPPFQPFLWYLLALAGASAALIGRPAESAK